MPDIDSAVRFRDAFGNVTHLVSIRAPHSEIAIIARGTVETQDKAGFVRGLSEVAPPRVFRRETVEDGARRGHPRAGRRPRGRRRHRPSARADGRRRRAGEVRGGRDERLDQCGRGAQGRVAASARITPTSSFRRRGSWVFPARYVNGYFVTGGESASEAQHAWAEAYIDGLGWLGFDPANQVCPTDRYVRLACGLDARLGRPDYRQPPRRHRRGS